MPKSKRVEKECLYCKNKFESFLSEKKIFCCKLCYRMSQIGCKEKKKCPVCNKEFLSHICKQQECCSKKCKHIQHGKKLSQRTDKKCLFCEKIFSINPSHANQNFCSLKCYSLNTRHHSLKIRRGGPKCKICGEITAHSRSVYCSKGCMAKSYEGILRKERNPNWRGGKNKRFSSGISLKLREKVFLRDKNQCRGCGVKNWDRIPSLLHVHHIVEVKDGGTNDLENLETLCFVCHFEGKHGYKLNKHLQQIASETGCGIRQTSS